MKISTLATLLATALLCQACTAARMIAFNTPTTHDSELFLNAILPAADTPFEPSCRVHYNACPTIDSLFEDDYTTGIIILRGDSIIYSRFEGRHTIDTPADLFSLSKSFVGALVGIAISQGYISSPHDPVSKYLPQCAEILSDSTCVCDLLNMRSGVHETHWQMAHMYYTPNLDRTTPRTIRRVPHGEYHYANLSTQLLACLIEQATGRPLTDYFIDNYWIPTAPRSEGYWSVDSRRNLNPRAFCGLSITPIDVLKLGMIYRDGGILNGRQIVPAEWVHYTVNPPYTSADRGGSTYHCQWYILEPDTEFMGQGLMGQILYINRTTDTIVARFGIRRGKTDWTAELRRISALSDRYFR